MLLQKIKDLIVSLKVTYFKLSTSESFFSLQSVEAEEALKNGNWEKYLEYNSPKNIYLDYSRLGVQLLSSDNLDLFKKLEIEGLQRKKIDDKFYDTMHDWAMARNSHKIIKHLYSNNKIKNKFVVSNENLLTMSKNKSIELLDYFVYDIKITTPREYELKIADAKNNYQNYEGIVKIFEKRDLLLKLNNNLIVSSIAPISKRKI